MNCQDTQDLLSAYLDLELRDDERTEVARHLEGCTACQAERSVFLGLKETLRKERAPAIPAALVAQIEAETIFKRHWWSAYRWRWIPTMAIAGALGAWTLVKYLPHKQATVPLEALVAQHRQYERGVPLAHREMTALHRASDIESAEPLQ